jgi:hypothetical protein
MSLEDASIDILRQGIRLEEKVAALVSLWEQSNQISLFLASKHHLLSLQLDLTLELLILGANITDDDAVAIAEALKRNPKLQNLYLGHELS